MKLKGTLKLCKGCGLAKAIQKAVSKISLKKATEIGEHLYIDTAGPFTETSGGLRYIFWAVDEFSQKGWVKFGPRKPAW